MMDKKTYNIPDGEVCIEAQCWW